MPEKREGLWGFVDGTLREIVGAGPFEILPSPKDVIERDVGIPLPGTLIKAMTDRIKYTIQSRAPRL